MVKEGRGNSDFPHQQRCHQQLEITGKSPSTILHLLGYVCVFKGYLALGTV